MNNKFKYKFILMHILMNFILIHAPWLQAQTNTPTLGPSTTPTSTRNTSTPVPTPTHTPTNELTNTPIPTITPVNTSTTTSIGTSTSTPTDKPTSTHTETPTITPDISSTPTYTSTDTPTSTYTSPDTPTPTITNTFTTTPTPPVHIVPFCDGFESGTLMHWVQNAGGSGITPIVITERVYHSGSWGVKFSDHPAGGYSTATLDLYMNLAGETSVQLDFWWITRGFHLDEFISLDIFDGSWHLDFIQYRGRYWEGQSVDLAASFSMIDGFIIRFRSYMDASSSAKYARLDDVCVYNPLIMTVTPILTPTPTSVCDTGLSLYCGMSYHRVSDDTSGKPNNFISYNCSPHVYDGPEDIYRCPGNSFFTVEIIDSGSRDFDLFILENCNPDECIAYGENRLDGIVLISPLTPYFLVVDEKGGTSGGPYTLEVSINCFIPPSSSNHLVMMVIISVISIFIVQLFKRRGFR